MFFYPVTTHGHLTSSIIKQSPLPVSPLSFHKHSHPENRRNPSHPLPSIFLLEPRDAQALAAADGQQGGTSQTPSPRPPPPPIVDRSGRRAVCGRKGADREARRLDRRFFVRRQFSSISQPPARVRNGLPPFVSIIQLLLLVLEEL